MNKLNIEKAIEKYNELMEMVGHEHCTINTCWSEDTEGWNIRDMVAECDYVLSCYFEGGHCFEEMRHSEDEDERKMWRSETGKLTRFINRYLPYINGVKCVSGHCSKYDN